MDKTDFITWARKLADNYQPSADVRAQLAGVDLVAIVGPTGVGKSTIISKLELPFVHSDVSRKKRLGEKNDTYHFRADYLEIINEIKNGQYVQFFVSQYDEFYGTRASAYPKNGHCTMAIVARLMPLFRNLGFRSVTSIYVMPPSYIEWMRRIGGVRSEELTGRIDEARESILLAQEQADQYHFVLNDSLELAVTDIQRILSGGQAEPHRSQLAYDTADVILERIGDG